MENYPGLRAPLAASALAGSARMPAPRVRLSRQLARRRCFRDSEPPPASPSSVAPARLPLLRRGPAQCGARALATEPPLCYANTGPDTETHNSGLTFPTHVQ